MSVSREETTVDLELQQSSKIKNIDGESWEEDMEEENKERKKGEISKVDRERQRSRRDEGSKNTRSGGSFVPCRNPDTKVLDRLWVGGLPEGITDQDIREIYEPHGVVKEIKLMVSATDTYCFIDFETEDMANHALVETQKLMLAGKPIRVSFANKSQKYWKSWDAWKDENRNGGKGGGAFSGKGKGKGFGEPWEMERPYGEERERGRRDMEEPREWRDRGGDDRKRKDYDRYRPHSPDKRPRDDRINREDRGRRAGREERVEDHRQGYKDYRMERDTVRDRGSDRDRERDGGRRRREEEDRGHKTEYGQGKYSQGRSTGHAGRSGYEGRDRPREGYLPHNVPFGRAVAEPRSGPPPPPPPGKSEGWRMVIENLPRDMTWQELKEIGQDFGSSVSFARTWRTPKGITFGLLEYRERRDYERGMKSLDGKKMEMWPERMKVYPAPDADDENDHIRRKR